MNEGSGGTAPAADVAASPVRFKVEIEKIDFSDVGEAFAAGVADFRAAPAYGLFFGGVFAVGGMIMVAAAAFREMLHLVYPLAAGFALIGPFAAVGLYEVSRRREAGERLDPSGILGVVFAQSRREFGWMAFVTLFVFILWMYQVRLLIALFFGMRGLSFHDLVPTLLGTPEGWMFLVAGHAVGALLALLLFSLTVVSFPLLLDRDVDFVTAMITSVRAVTTNPKPMMGWAACVVGALAVAAMPFFLGLFIVLPVLGHTTWHLYRKAVRVEGATT